MNQQEIEKLKTFNSDKVLVNAVFSVLQDSFMKRRESDVQFLAAKSLALEFLEDARKELSKYKRENEKEIGKNTTNHL